MTTNKTSVHKLWAVIFTGLVSVLFQTSAIAWDGFSPYREDEKPKAFSNQVFAEPGWDAAYEVLTIKTKDGFSIHYNEAENGEAVLVGAKNNVLASAKGLGKPMWGVCVVEGDFNQDGKPDFALMMGNGGNGMAADFGQWVFYLSCPTGYKPAILDTDTIDLDDLIELGNDGCLRILHTSLVDVPSGVTVSGGRQLYFYIYRLLRVKGTDFEEDRVADPRFPKIVAYMRWSQQQNHKETKLLSAAQKVELLKDHPIKIRQGADALRADP